MTSGLRFLPAVACVWAVSAPAAQSVPEGIHSIAQGPKTICGIYAGSAAEFEDKVKALPGARHVEDTDQFIIYEGPVDYTQWVFAKPTNYAYPLATCRNVYVENGQTMMGRDMLCDDNRQDCDRAFVEFNSLDQQMIAAARNRIK